MPPGSTFYGIFTIVKIIKVYVAANTDYQDSRGTKAQNNSYVRIRLIPSRYSELGFGISDTLTRDVLSLCVIAQRTVNYFAKMSSNERKFELGIMNTACGSKFLLSFSSLPTNQMHETLPENGRHVSIFRKMQFLSLKRDFPRQCRCEFGK